MNKEINSRPQQQASRDTIGVLKLGLPTPSQDIATRDIRKDSLQNIMSILVHQKFPAHKQDLLLCAYEREAEPEVLEFIQKLPNKTYTELSMIMENVPHMFH